MKIEHLPSENLEQYRQALNHLEDIIIVINREGDIKYVNDALRLFFNRKGEFFTGKNIAETRLIENEAGMSSDDIVKKMYDEADFETTVTDGYGDRRYLSWKCKVFDLEGKEKAIAVIRDVTEMVDLQRQVEEYNENLQEMVQQRTRELEKQKNSALELAQAKALFLSKMTHEFRTPLTAISGYCELIEDLLGKEQPEAHKYLHIIERNSRNLLEIIDDVLDMVKLEQDRYTIKESNCAVRDLIEEIKETYSIFAREKGTTLSLLIAKDVPKIVRVDSIAVRRIMTNLINNALKYTPQGAIEIEVKIRQFSQMRKKKLYFYVQDTGIGIPIDQQKVIFKPFVQGASMSLPKQRGSGLGLAICKHLAKLMGGNVKLVHSEVNKGSTFVFSLPIRF